jgi:cystathionine beta-lyase/cystathionine gamma-synthase
MDTGTSVTSIINEAHLDTSATLGSNDIGQSLSKPLTPDINFSSAYAFDTIENLGAYHASKIENLRYTRDGSSLSRQVEFYFEKMYNVNAALLFNTGMAAVASAIEILLTETHTVVSFGVNYRKTKEIIDQCACRKGITIRNYETFKNLEESDSGDGEGLLIFCENFSNPYLNFTEIQKIRLSYPKSKIIVDFTMQGLMNYKEDLRHCDIAVTSCTKYVGGHNDFLAGCALFFNPKYVENAWSYRSSRGNILSPFSSFLLLRSLRTYDLRIKQILGNTSKVLGFLDEHYQVKRLFYPGRYHNLRETDALKCTHGGGVVSFRVKDHVPVEQNLAELRSMKMAPSFGSVDTLIEVPLYMSQGARNGYRSKFDRENLLSDRFIRLSVGCEPIEYIINDLKILLKSKSA